MEKEKILVTRSASILVVDDEEAFCNSLKSLLQAHGYRVDNVYSGTDALARLKNTEYQVVVLDIGLPDISGNEVLQFIGKHLPASATIVLTGGVSAGNAIAALRSGAFDYIRKPFDPEQLLRSVSNAIELKQSEQDLKKAYDIINRSPAVAFIWRNAPGWPVDFVSANCMQLTGYSREDFISGSIVYEKIIHPDDLKRVSAEVEQGNSGPGIINHEPYRIISKDGSVKWISDKTRVRHNSKGEPYCYEGIVTDITDNKRLEEILLTSKKFWEQTFDAIPDIVLIQDRDLRIIRANKATSRFCKKEFREIIGRYCFEVFGNLTSPCPECPAVHALNDFKSLSRIVQYHSQEKIFRITSSPLVEDDCDIQYIVTVAQDLTEQKKLEKQVFHLQKMEAISTLTAGIAHDFNNLLTVIMGSAQLLSIQSSHSQQNHDNIAQILTAGKKASGLVERLLTFCRRALHQQQPLVPDDIVVEALQVFRATLPGAVQLNENIRNDGGMILADPTRIHQIVFELCTNALHALDNEGGVITVGLCREDLTEEDVFDRLIVPGPFLVLSVNDTGCGMDAATMKRIFDPYYTTKEVGKGRGLGLAGIYGIAGEYKGEVTVNSRLGSGTTFKVYFPLIARKSRAPGRAKRLLPAGEEHILFVDDEESIVEMAKNLLEDQGYKVTGTTDGMTAYAMFRDDPSGFDVLITDQMMPMLTGLELAEKIFKIKKEMPILLCSGYSDRINKKEALSLGIKKFIAKPMTLKKLSAAIRIVLDDSKRSPAPHLRSIRPPHIGEL